MWVNIELSKNDTNALPSTFLLDPIIIQNVNMFAYDENGNKVEKQSEREEYIFKDGFMGVSFFKHFNVVFDYPNEKLYLKKYD